MRYINLLIISCLASCSAPESEWYIGVWQVTDAKFPGVSAMGMEEAEEWFGDEATYSNNKVTFRDESCAHPEFQVTSSNAAEFYANFRARFQDLEITGESVEILEVVCSGNWVAPGALLIRATDNTAYTLWDGVFFKLEKIK